MTNIFIPTYMKIIMILNKTRLLIIYILINHNNLKNTENLKTN